VSYEQIIYAKNDGIATVTLIRPQVLNAFTPTMIEEWLRYSPMSRPLAGR
jgi:1,4-dihydroxy-2-naphthoyl-CoA synthase